MKRFGLVLSLVMALVLMPAAPAQAQEGPLVPCWEDLVKMAYQLTAEGVKVTALVAGPEGRAVEVGLETVTDLSKVLSVYFNGVGAKNVSTVSKLAGQSLNYRQANDWLSSFGKQGATGFGYYQGDFFPCKTPPSGGSKTGEEPSWNPKTILGYTPLPKSNGAYKKLPWAAIGVSILAALVLALLVKRRVA